MWRILSVLIVDRVIYAENVKRFHFFNKEIRRRGTSQHIAGVTILFVLMSFLYKDFKILYYPVDE